MLKTNIQPEMIHSLRQITHDLCSGGVQVWLKGPVKVGEVILWEDILQMDVGIGSRPHAPNLFMFLENGWNKPVLLENTCRGNPRNARPDDSDPWPFSITIMYSPLHFVRNSWNTPTGAAA
jgi:hypothetical protein